MAEKRTPVRCGECLYPTAMLVENESGRFIEIKARHHGRTHFTLIPIEQGSHPPLDRSVKAAAL